MAGVRVKPPFDKLGTGKTVQVQGAFSTTMHKTVVDTAPLITLVESGCILHKNDGYLLLFSIQMGAAHVRFMYRKFSKDPRTLLHKDKSEGSGHDHCLSDREAASM